MFSQERDQAAQEKAAREQRAAEQQATPPQMGAYGDMGGAMHGVGMPG